MSTYRRRSEPKEAVVRFDKRSDADTFASTMDLEAWDRDGYSYVTVPVTRHREVNRICQKGREHSGILASILYTK